MARVFSRRIISAMWALGMPATDARFADVVRAALAAGLDDNQAFQLAKLAYDAANGYTWKITEGGQRLERATRDRNAREHPNGKDAEELDAERAGRTSRWGTPEFHRGETASIVERQS